MKRRRWLTAPLALGLAAAVLLAACGGDDSRTLTVFAAASLTDAFQEISDRFEEEHPDVRVQFSFGGSQRLRFQLEQGAHADVFASADQLQLELAQAAGLVPRGPTLFVANTVVLVVPASNPANLSGLNDLLSRQVRLVIAGPAVPAGRATREALQAAAILDAVLASVVSEEDNVRAVLTKVVVGEADDGFVWRTDALAAGADVLQFLLPTAVASGYGIARTTDARDASLADAFVAFVRSRDGLAVLIEAGFLPAAN